MLAYIAIKRDTKLHIAHSVGKRIDIIADLLVWKMSNILSPPTHKYPLEIYTDGDHVHILVSAPPRYSPSRVMQIIKSITGRKMFEKFPDIKKQLWGGELWSDGRFVGTIGQTLGLEDMKKYIKRQGDKD